MVARVVSVAIQWSAMYRGNFFQLSILITSGPFLGLGVKSCLMCSATVLRGASISLKGPLAAPAAPLASIFRLTFSNSSTSRSRNMSPKLIPQNNIHRNVEYTSARIDTFLRRDFPSKYRTDVNGRELFC